MDREQLAAAFGISWFDYQLDTLDAEASTPAQDLRVCLYYRTGAGKTFTSLALMVQAGQSDVLVVAPPKTHPQWRAHAAAAGVSVETISHAKYRMKTYKVFRTKAVIVDEFHLLGGQSGAGFSKLRVHARHIQAPLVILSATPNYNDVERVYCVANALDPHGTKGGYLQWLYDNCNTQNNPFGAMPLVEGFRDGRAAKYHLAELPHVYHVEDEHEDFPISEVVLPTSLPEQLVTYGLDRRHGRIVASRMEFISASRKHQLLDDDGRLREEVYDVLVEQAGLTTTPVLVFCARAQIAKAAHEAALQHGARSDVVVYEPNTKKAQRALTAFKNGELDVLFGTATMATGVDGLDRVCDMLILLDDTNDDALRRQVIGRILPRGAAKDVSRKLVVRLLLGEN